MADGSVTAFFKVLLGDFSEKLRIPGKFVRAVIGGREWRAVRLRVCSVGNVWTVKVLKESDGSHFFGGGWREFVLAHGLCFGYFLVFKYEGNMNFLVQVFDLSECGRYYGPIVRDGGRAEDGAHDHKKSRKVSKKPKEEPVTYSQCQVLDSARKDILSTDDVKVQDLKCKCDAPNVSRSSTSYKREHGGSIKHMARNPDTMPEIAKQEANCGLGSETFQSQTLKRPFFEITAKKGYCNGGSKYLHIPVKFDALDYLSSTSEVILTDQDKMSWRVKMSFSSPEDSENLRYARLTTGWLKFFREKNIEEGDVCRFELMSEGEVAEMVVSVEKRHVLQSNDMEDDVQIIEKKIMKDIIDVDSYVPLKRKTRFLRRRKGVDGDYSTTSICKRKVPKADQGLKKRKSCELSTKPEFTLMLRHRDLCNSKSYLYVPRVSEGGKLLCGRREGILQNVEGKSWHVNLYNGYGKKAFRIGAGWYKCATENRLKAGDVCRFKVVSEKDAVIRFEVQRKIN